MNYWMGGGWDGWPAVHMIFWLLVLAAFVLWAWAVIRSRNVGEQGDDRSRRPSALDLLDERYARGEIAREEYLERKRDILGR